MLLDTVQITTARYAGPAPAHRILGEAQALAEAAAADLRAATAAFAAHEAVTQKRGHNDVDRRMLAELLDRCEMAWAEAETNVLLAKASARQARSQGEAMNEPSPR